MPTVYWPDYMWPIIPELCAENPQVEQKTLFEQLREFIYSGFPKTFRLRWPHKVHYTVAKSEYWVESPFKWYLSSGERPHSIYRLLNREGFIPEWMQIRIPSDALSNYYQSIKDRAGELYSEIAAIPTITNGNWIYNQWSQFMDYLDTFNNQGELGWAPLSFGTILDTWNQFINYRPNFEEIRWNSESTYASWDGIQYSANIGNISQRTPTLERVHWNPDWLHEFFGDISYWIKGFFNTEDY